MKDLSKYQSQMEQMIAFAKHNNFDIVNATEDEITEMFKAWLNHGRLFYDRFKSFDINTKKSLLKLDW